MLEKKGIVRLSRRFHVRLHTIIENSDTLPDAALEPIHCKYAPDLNEMRAPPNVLQSIRRTFIQLKSVPRNTWIMGFAWAMSFCALVYLDREQSHTRSHSKWARMMYETDNNNNHNNLRSISPPLTTPPTDLHIAFVGDSVTRYMYLALVYFLKTGTWVHDDDYPNILNAKQFPSWNDHYNFSNTALSPHEQCDCFRNNPYNASHINKEETIENRYFSDPESNNYVTFIEVFGGYPAHGHWDPKDVYAPHELHFGDQEDFAWRYDWSGLIRNYLANLEPKPEYLVFNEGLWVEHELGDASVRQSIKDALDETGIVGIYKTTTLPNINSALAKRSSGIIFNRHDQAMCDLFGTHLDFGWTKDLDDEHYWDGVHFKPHVNRGMNMQLLDLLEKLKDNKKRKVSSTVV